MPTFDEWMGAVRRTGNRPASKPLSTPCRVPADVVYAYVMQNPMRSRTLAGCRIRVAGRGFADVVRVDHIQLWVDFNVGDKGAADGDWDSIWEVSEAANLECILIWEFKQGAVTDVIFAAGSKHALVHAAMKLKEAPPAAPLSSPAKQLPPSPPNTPPNTPPLPPTTHVVPTPISKRRSQEIKDFCEARDIECLLHFTRAENVNSIIQNGLVSRTVVDQWREQSGDDFPVVCEKVRRDDHRSAISASISFPNYKLFYVHQSMLSGDWAVIRLKASVLWKLDCAFCHTNASNKSVKRIDINERRSEEAFKAMFANTKDNLRRRLEIPDRYTTDPQAEVLVLEPVAQEYVEGVYFQRNAPTGGWREARGTHVIFCEVDKRVFAPRMDYQHW